MQDNTPSNIPSDNSAMYAFYLKAIVVFAALLGFYYGWFLDSAWYDKLLAFIVENTSKLLHGLGLEHKVAFDRMAGFAEIRTEVRGGIVNGGLVLILWMVLGR
ncbi:MAG: hypothetical protein EX270_09710 [Pseudomonadales bacterium]|nr:MAG: hypothetical protein EX270_09710 [Pseudomonadales bacterium]